MLHFRSGVNNHWEQALIQATPGGLFTHWTSLSAIMFYNGCCCFWCTLWCTLSVVVFFPVNILNVVLCLLFFFLLIFSTLSLFVVFFLFIFSTLSFVCCFLPVNILNIVPRPLFCSVARADGWFTNYCCAASPFYLNSSAPLLPSKPSLHIAAHNKSIKVKYQLLSRQYYFATNSTYFSISLDINSSVSVLNFWSKFWL